MIQVQEVRDKKDLKRFVNFPYDLYRNCAYWVPPLLVDKMNTLRKDKNPAFEYCEARYWLALKEGKVVGRIAGIINHSFIQVWGKPWVRFGWLDFIDDGEVAKSLLRTVEEWAREREMEAVHGPLGFCDLDPQGMLVDGFNQRGTMVTIYNYPYYPEYIQDLGYEKDVDWVEYAIDVPREIPKRPEYLLEKVKNRSKYRLAQIGSKKELWAYVPQIFDLLNQAYKKLYGVVPITERQAMSIARQYFTFLNLDFVKIVLNGDGEVVAFAIAMPSLSRALQRARGRLFPLGFFHLWQSLRKSNILDLYLVAVRPDLQGFGVNVFLMVEMTKTCIEKGIIRGESSPGLEENWQSQALWKYYNKKQHKRRRCFIKKLT